MSKLKTKKLPSFIKKKSTIKKFHKRNSIAYIKKNYVAKEFLKDINEEKIFDLKHLSNKNLEINYDMKKKINYDKFKSEIEIMKINNHLRKNINFIKLKKKISKIKESLINIPDIKNKNNFDDFRILKREKVLYDSLDEEDFKEELLGFYISPDSWYIKLFDIILLLISISYSIFVPFLLSINYFSKNDNNMINYVFILIDIIYMVDFFLCFFKGYKNFYEHLIIKPTKIIRHYLKTWFLLIFEEI